MLAGALGSTGSVFWVLTFGTTSGSRCCVLFSSKLRALGQGSGGFRVQGLGLRS